MRNRYVRLKFLVVFIEKAVNSCRFRQDVMYRACHLIYNAQSQFKVEQTLINSSMSYIASQRSSDRTNWCLSIVVQLILECLSLYIFSWLGITVQGVGMWVILDSILILFDVWYGSSGQRHSGKGRGSAATLPYVIPCTTDTGQTSDSSDGNDDKRVGEGGKVTRRKVCCTHTLYNITFSLWFLILFPILELIW